MNVGLFLHTPFPSSELFRTVRGYALSAANHPPTRFVRHPLPSCAHAQRKASPLRLVGGGPTQRPCIERPDRIGSDRIRASGITACEQTLQLAHREEILYGMLAADHIGFGLFE